MLFLYVAAAHSAEVTIRWVGTIQNTDIRFEGQFSFPTDDPAATSIVDLLTVGTNTDVVVSDGITSQTWSHILPAPPFDSLLFRYCPGGESQCSIPAPGAFVASLQPSWTGTPLQTDCGAFTQVPCSVNVVSFRGEDPPLATVFTDVGLAAANFTFEIISNPPGNEAPTANAGIDGAVRVGDTVYLDGSGSFDDNTATASLGYAWSFSSLPIGSSAVLQGADSALPTFIVDIAGTYAVQLVVTDEGGLPSPADEVIVSSENLAPTADAGLDQLVIVNSSVSLNGSGSTDPEVDPLNYSWVISAAPVGSISSLVDADTAFPSFIPDIEGTYEAMLVVSDFIGPGVPDSVDIVVVSLDQFAVIKIVSANQVIVTLDPVQVTTHGNQNALSNFLAQATVAIQTGDLAEAISKLQKALSRTDGCVLRGDADKNGPGRDWITDCEVQTMVYESLDQALASLTP